MLFRRSSTTPVMCAIEFWCTLARRLEYLLNNMAPEPTSGSIDSDTIVNLGEIESSMHDAPMAELSERKPLAMTSTTALAVTWQSLLSRLTSSPTLRWWKKLNSCASRILYSRLRNLAAMRSDTMPSEYTRTNDPTAPVTNVAMTTKRKPFLDSPPGGGLPMATSMALPMILGKIRFMPDAMPMPTMPKPKGTRSSLVSAMSHFKLDVCGCAALPPREPLLASSDAPVLSGCTRPLPVALPPPPPPPWPPCSCSFCSRNDVRTIFGQVRRCPRARTSVSHGSATVHSGSTRLSTVHMRTGRSAKPRQMRYWIYRLGQGCMHHQVVV
ncbi:TPA: hypothetical protein N0F65_008146 [Lagenidium giganteum]|uniref:Uncharacterized protein n=1 Tax=Lagenidium giganteum TaxID=4803 RepID=A0AAV2YIU0_9STRA|nr:TPA: hypothetical protein N0F65_008146 [Lagenidium giganteum]